MDKRWTSALATRIATGFRSAYSYPWLLLTALLFFVLPITEAAFISFENCLDPNIINSRRPQLLQFVPLFLDARFEPFSSRHNLNITVYGNVTGQATVGDYPAPDDPIWNSNDTFGKIVDSTINFTTLFTSYHMLSYTPYTAPPAEFCNFTIDGACPWGPLFNASRYDPYQLHAFSVDHDFQSTYSFATLVPSLKIRSGDGTGALLACITASVTPYLGSGLSAAVRYVPAAVLILVGLATIAASRLSPWSSSNIFHWSSNWGRDQDILRLVTPGFGDCLQYIQFVVLAGSLSLNYPGYYQPVISRLGWSVLMFNESFVSNGKGAQSLVDGVYITNSTYGLERVSQLVGMTKVSDIWGGMAVWLAVLVAVIIVLCQIGLLGSWVGKKWSDTMDTDLRSKNLPFTAGNLVRLVYNYFLLPIISLSMFQWVVSTQSPAGVVAMSVILVLAIMTFASWIFYKIFTTKPRAHLFDHLPTLLLYGPLYNTYSDVAAPFAFIPAFLTFFRGIAIGGLQPSGIAQLVMLAICEVILVLTLHAFRPFQSLTSMNAYHTFFATVKLITILLSVAFVPSIGVSEASKGWIGYAILLLHAIVLVFGFFLNALQTLIEVFARMVGAGNRDTRGGLTKVFGVRQLSKRVKNPQERMSLGSDAAVLTRDADLKSLSNQSRSRSQSASSHMLLNHANKRASSNFDQMSQDMGSTFSMTSPGSSTPGAGPASPTQFIGLDRRRSTFVSKALEPSDPYYRPPRQRRPTLELLANQPGGEIPYEDLPVIAGGLRNPVVDTSDSISMMSHDRASIAPSHARNARDGSDPALDSSGVTDYATRESDYYYNLRGPALSSQPSRRRKTGPADPISPVASATGWFRNLFGGGRAVKSKGFEVVRSTPLHLLPMEEEEEQQQQHEPYLDSPERRTMGRTITGAERSSVGSDFVSYDAYRAERDPDSTNSNTKGPTEMSVLEHPPREMDATPPPSTLVTPVSFEQSSRAVNANLPPPIPLESKPRPGNPRQASFRRTLELSSYEAAASRIPFAADSDPSPEQRADDGRSRSSTMMAGGEDLAQIPSGSSAGRQDSIASIGAMDTLRPNAPFTNAERPYSTGKVSHHVGDSIHEAMFDEKKYMGSQAEILGIPSPPGGVEMQEKDERRRS